MSSYPIITIAGPSRLTKAVQLPRAVPPLLHSFHPWTHSSRRSATTSSSAESVSDTRSRGRGNRAGPVPKSRQEWESDFASIFHSSPRGRKARWLGDSVPYPGNPTFKPPPPLSNELQDSIHAELRTGAKTVGQIADRFNVSKARIEAIRKLKGVEEEYIRQGMPLQYAFLQGMQPLLGVAPAFRSPRRASSSVENEAAEREMIQLRHEDTTATLERDEESRFEAGIGGGGSFGDRVAQRGAEGLERTVWEFRGEDEVVEAMASEQAGRRAEEVGKGTETEAEEDRAVRPVTVKGSVEGVRMSADEAASESETGSIRFVDMSSNDAPWSSIGRKKSKSGNKSKSR
ncbi:hypothetical protein M231_07045 [Tremella mesenterica]|uniref:Eukaryotic mitochondrial regulator protein-domain-containing protein n=1 Tax=Tremella mesenterica TaxID=5217 RepID=A0A4Q1BA81_TREME|nr:hypothetical protein M231_07045 [Tremella mesenterica]